MRFVTAAAEIMQEPRATAALFEFAKVQQCLRVTFMMLENIMGPEMGPGCPDRAVAIMTQWAAYDDRFKHWAHWFHAPESESPAWHFAKTIILAPTAKWMSRIWQFWCDEVPDPGSLELCLSEDYLLAGSAKHQLMSQKLAKLQLQSRGGHQSDTGSSESESSSESEDVPTLPLVCFRTPSLIQYCAFPIN
eukprot:COSAG02_NODE_9498_length_2197_cov_3.437083_2_plen_191_part_00